MCFSAGASFGAGAVLSVVGVWSMKKADGPRQLIFGSIPLIFSVQQICEGFLWLSLRGQNESQLQNACTHLFLFFAQVVWPLWVPLAIYLMETEEKRKKMLVLLLAAGISLSSYLAYCLYAFPVKAFVLGQHIAYHLDYPRLPFRINGVFYLLVTILPPFVSSVKRMWSLGAAILLSYLLTVIFYEEYVISVWCFFASVISVVVLFILHQMQSLGRKNDVLIDRA